MMNEIKLSFDNQSFQSKPSGDEVRGISNRIATSAVQINGDGLLEVLSDIGNRGCSFSPATFKDGKRNKENFEQQQLIVLDFDNKNPDKQVSFDEIKARADLYEMHILAAYETMSGTERDKFRVVFLNDAPITDKRVAESVQMAMGEMFPEADPSCYKDVSKLYFGGKGEFFIDKNIPTINIESIFRNLTCYMKDRYKANHYKDRLYRFSKETGIALTKHGLLDVISSDYLPETDNPTEEAGVNSVTESGKNSPMAIICKHDDSNIKADGEIFPERFYRVKFNVDGTGKSSVKTLGEKSRNHKLYRAEVLQDMKKKCRLFNEFATGSRKLHHGELFGIATNLIQVETGAKYFTGKREEHPELYPSDAKNGKWKTDISYMVQNEYYSQACDAYCPYREECTHCENILKTVHPNRGSMEKISGYHEVFGTMEEMQEDIYEAVNRAYWSNDRKFYVIKAQAGGGKSHSYLRIMEENPDSSFLIAAPTNLLKKEIYEKAKKQGKEILLTPSLEAIKDKIPHEIWNHIQELYKKGQHGQVHTYIQKQLKKEDVPYLRKYMKKREKLRTWHKSVVTTHRYLLSMDEERLGEFDSIIIDEDIIFKSIISNQGEITRSELKKLQKETTSPQLSEKINGLLKASKTQSCIEAEALEWDEEDMGQKSMCFDIPSFCMAERFYLRRPETERNIAEDTFAFLKPANFPGEKYIIVSATADKEIYQWYFGEDNVDFYECTKAAYQGNLMQYPEKSMSRSCLANNPGIVNRLRRRFHMREDNVITFMSENVGSLHFGNTEGSNTLEGQDILVIGTPYHAEFIYKLVAFFMGVEFDENEGMALQNVEHDVYKFWFTTFRNAELRKIHFWMIESELEQAVGRARLLRNACTVHLFSNFPMSQSELVENFDYEKD